MLKAALPVGELATRAARAISNAHRRRAERNARVDVVRALQDFQAQRFVPN
jgi:hypothetical protein